MLSRFTSFVAIACAASAGACSDLLGADFEDRHLRTNRAPVAADAELADVVEGTTGNTLQLSASDPENDALSYHLMDPRPRGRASIDKVTGLLTYESDFGIWDGGFEDEVRYGVRDASKSAEATVKVRLLPAGPLPLKAKSIPRFASDTQQIYFGASVDFDGDRVIVGATLDGAYILRRMEDGTWEHDQKIDPPEPFLSYADAEMRSFGWDAALSGEWALVSAYGSFHAPSLPGQAHFYKLKDGKYEWAQTVCALAGNCDAGPVDRFGMDVALEGRFAVVAAKDDPSDDPEPNRKPSVGAVYVYELHEPSGEWRRVAKLRAPDPAAYDLFGSSIALDGTALAVAAMGTDTVIRQQPLEVEDDTGAVYMFELGNLERPGTKLLRPSAGNLTGFRMGHVALSGDRLLLGVPSAPRTINNMLQKEVGIAFLYQRVDGDWEAPTALEQPPDLAIADAQFGLGVGIDGNIAVVTRRASNINGGLFVYRAEIEQPGSQVAWVRRETWLDETTSSAGWTVAVEGPAVLVGAPFERHGGAQAFHVPLEPKAAFLCATGLSIRADECISSRLSP